MAAPRRRSARILALGDTMKAQRAHCEELEAFFEYDEVWEQKSGSEPPKKRGRKKRKIELEENAERSSPNNDGSSGTRLPEKRLLKLVVNTLGKMDSEKYFALPVDILMIPHYYKVVKKPMDFMSINGKLDNGDYKFLEQFERDIFLVFKNAIHFNGPKEPCSKQAEILERVGKKMFQKLREDPTKLEKCCSNIRAHILAGTLPDYLMKKKYLPEYSLRRKPGRKPKTETKTTNEYIEHRDARSTYKPWKNCLGGMPAIISEYSSLPKQVPTKTSIGYKKSVTCYSKDLGPAVQKYVGNKLQQCTAPDPNPNPDPSHNPNPDPIPSQIPSSGVVPSRAPTGTAKINLNLLPVDEPSENQSFLSLMTDGQRPEPRNALANPAAPQQLVDFPSPNQAMRDVCLDLRSNQSSSPNKVQGFSMFASRPPLPPPRPTSLVHPSVRVYPANPSGVLPSTRVVPAQTSIMLPRTQVSQAQPSLVSPYSESNQFSSVVSPSTGVVPAQPNLSLPSNNRVSQADTSLLSLYSTSNQSSSVVPPSTGVVPAQQSLSLLSNRVSQAQPSLLSLYSESNQFSNVVSPSTRVDPAQPSLSLPSNRVSQPLLNLLSPYSESNQFGRANSPGQNRGFLGRERLNNNRDNFNSTVQPRVNSPGVGFGQGNAALNPGINQGNHLDVTWNQRQRRTDNHNHLGVQPRHTHLNLNALPAPAEASRYSTIGPSQSNSPPWNQQVPINDWIRNAVMNSWPQNRAAQVQAQPIGLGPPASVAVPASIHARTIIQNQQPQQNTTQASLEDNPEPNVVLRL